MPKDMQRSVEQHHAILRKVIETNKGQVFQILGDAFQAAFCLATDGLRAAIQAQYELQSAEWGATGPLKVRMGLHTGPLELNLHPGPSGQLEYAVCHTLNRAARVMSVGYGGQILVSQETKSLIERDLPEGVDLRDLGEHQLKGMRKLEHLYMVIATNLPIDFPTLATGVVHPNNLPFEMTSFVGREKEITELMRILADPKLRQVTVIGAGGMGKTRLALRVAESMIDTYEDGVWLVELVSLSDPAYVPQVVAQTLSIRDVPGQPIIRLIQEHLHKKHLLLVLDNCEHLRSAVADLANHLLRACPHLQIMATSRETLGLDGEISYVCPSLISPNRYPVGIKYSLEALPSNEVNAAVRLFAERAAIASPGFYMDEKDISIINDICQRLDGIPLAIELAAARVRVLGLKQIVNRLDDAFHLLTGGNQLVIPHHQTLQASIDWSYNLLSTAEKTLLLRLSVFAGGWDMDAAEAVASGNGIETREVLDLVAQLLDKSLILFENLENGINRYRMLETIRQYANEKLMETEEYPVIRKRHLEYFSQLAEEAAPQLWEKEQKEWVQRLMIENDNIRVALQWALNRKTATLDEIESGGRMAASLSIFWNSYGVVKEAENWTTMALQRLTRPNETRARLLAAEGIFNWQLGKLSMAASSLKEALDLFYLLEDTPGLAYTTHMYGHIVFDQQNYGEAERVFKESLSLYEAMGDNTGIKISLISDLGLVACHQGDLTTAQDYYEKSLALSIQNELKENEGQSYLRLGDIARLEGNYMKAREFYNKSLGIFREIKLSKEIASSLHKLGYIALHQGNIDQARALFLESLTLQNKASNQQGIAECLVGLASVKVKNEEDEEAAEFFGAAKGILTRTGLPISPADLAEWARDEEVGRLRCDPKRFEQAWSRGSAASIDDLVAGLLSSLSSSAKMDKDTTSDYD